MRRLTIISIAATLALAACGGDEEETPATGASGTTGSSTAVETAAGIATAGDYMEASIPDQGAAVQELAESESACDGVDTKLGGDFQVGVAIAAASASADTPLTEIVAGECEEG